MGGETELGAGGVGLTVVDDEVEEEDENEGAKDEVVGVDETFTTEALMGAAVAGVGAGAELKPEAGRFARLEGTKLVADAESLETGALDVVPVPSKFGAVGGAPSLELFTDLPPDVIELPPPMSVIVSPVSAIEVV